MRCAWQAYLNLLPIWMRSRVDNLGKDGLQEIRLRLQHPPELVISGRSYWLDQIVTSDDLNFCINIATRYSPWAAATVSEGFITAQGGHRIGICGEAIQTNGVMSGICAPSSLCLRVARDFPGIADRAAALSGSILILGAPGWGKTTLLRDLIRQKSNMEDGCIAVVDERGELFPKISKEMCFSPGKRTDVLLNCKKAQGISFVLRTMSPRIIAVDEITAKEDCDALIHAGWCGVSLLATAHAASKTDLMNRPVYRPIIESNLFEWMIILRQNQSWTLERMKL